MDIAMIGLGKMGGNMTTRLLQDGHRVVVYDLNEEPISEAVAEGAEGAQDLGDVVARLEPPRAVWSMVPAGGPTESTVEELGKLLAGGDIVIDGGNSYYKDSLRRGQALAEKGIYFVDVGTSGGVWGLEQGYSMMVGGAGEAVEQIRPALETLAPGADKGWGHVGPVGSGHFVKMVHNGIEYGIMQAYAEGFELMNQKKEFELDLHQIGEIWRFGSVIRSWLLDLTTEALAQNPTMEGVAAYIPDSGEGRWTVAESIELACPIPVITLALQRRFRSRQESPFSDKLVSAMRHQFGGHAIKQVAEQ